MLRHAEHVEEFYGFVPYVGEGHGRAFTLSYINNPEQDRDPDAVHELGPGKINDDLFVAFVDLLPALEFELFAAEFIQIIARRDDRGAGKRSFCADAYFLCVHLTFLPVKIYE